MRTRMEEEEPQVMMAPLIDCVFLLLIFFLVAATLKKAHKEVEIELPHSAAAIETKIKYTTVVIEIAKDGTVYLDAEPVSTKVLHTRLRALAQENPYRRVRVDGDRRTALQYIVHVLDLCQFEGLKNVGIRTRD